MSKGAVSAVAVTVVLLAAWWIWPRGGAHIASGSCRGCNVLLITIDTLRADRVGAFGSSRNLTPTLDRLANEGLKLARAYASAPLTLPSHTSILTAVSPPVHGVRTNGLFRLGPKLPTLATVLKDAGYRTGAFVGAFVLDARFGLTRGFDVYDDRFGEQRRGEGFEGAERRAEDVIKPAFAWISARPSTSSGRADLARGEPVRPQAETARGEPVEPRARTARGEPVRPQAETVRGEPVEPRARTARGEPVEPRAPWFAWVHLYDPHAPYRAPEPWASRHEPYDAEVAYTDAMVGRLLDQLKSSGLLDRTLVVVAADHGESLGDHGERTHGTFVYEPTMRVPWIVWSADGTPRGEYDGLARLIDLAPTALDLVGVAAPTSFEGRSVVPAVAAGGAGAATAYLEAMDANLTRGWAPLTAIVAGRRKLIDVPIPELYDLSADPTETTNVYARDSERARTLESLLRDARSALDARTAGAEKAALSADARQRLQALGYTASSADPTQRVYTDADDPKTLTPVSNALNDDIAAFNRGDAAAVERVRAIVEAHPNFSTAYGELATMQRARGDLRGAIATLDACARRGAADPRSLLVLADDLTEAGDMDRASAVAEAVIAAHPDFIDAYNTLGVIAMRRGQHDRAQAAFRRVLAMDATSATAYANLAADDLARHDLPAAIDALRQAVALDPQNFDALYNLGMALDAAGRRDEARPYLERFVNEAPRERYARDIQAVRASLAGTKK